MVIHLFVFARSLRLFTSLLLCRRKWSLFPCTLKPLSSFTMKRAWFALLFGQLLSVSLTVSQNPLFTIPISFCFHEYAGSLHACVAMWLCIFFFVVDLTRLSCWRWWQWAVDDESIRMFVASPPVVDYFSDLITFLRQQSFGLDGLVAEVSKWVIHVLLYSFTGINPSIEQRETYSHVALKYYKSHFWGSKILLPLSFDYLLPRQVRCILETSELEDNTLSIHWWAA